MSRLYVVEIGPTIAMSADGMPMLVERSQKLSIRAHKIEYKSTPAGGLFFNILDHANNILFSTHAASLKYVWVQTELTDAKPKLELVTEGENSDGV